MTTSSSTVVLADITSLCNVIASLSSLKTTEVADSVTTTTTTTGDNETQLTGKLETVQRLLLEVKQILRKYYVIVEEAMTAAGNPSVAATSNTSISHTFTPPTTLEAFQLLQIFEAQINEQIRATSEEGTTTKGTLFRYLLIAALSYAVVGIANLLNLASTVPTSSSSTVPGTSSSSSVPESSQVQLSSQQESQIRLAIALTLRWAFFPTIERYFARADRVDRLFAVGRRLDAHHGMAGNFNNGHSSPTQENDSDIGEIFKLQPLYLVYISLLLMPTPGGPSVVLIPATIRDHSYALIIACYAIYRKFRLLTKRSSFSKTTPIIPETTKVSNSAASTTSESTFTFTEIEVSLRKALEAYLEESANQEYVVRELIGLIACAPNVFLKPLLVNILVRYYTQPNGIEVLLRAVLDSDPTSERETTVASRLIGIATMITSLELKDRRTFTESILRQTVELLLRHTEGTQVEETSPLTVPKHSDDIYWRTGAHILGRIAEKPEYTVLLKMILFDPLEAAFTGDNRHLVQGERPIGDVQAAIRVTYRLLLARVCPEHVAPLFSHLFYARLAYAKKKTVLVSEELESALKEALRELPKAYFLLDEAVHKEAIQEWTGRYDVNGEDGRLRILRKIERDDSEPPEEVARRIAELTVKLLGEREATDVTFRFNFFFLLLGRLNEGIGSGTATGQQPHSLVTLSLIESLSERLFGGTISKAQEEAREGKLLADPQTMRFLALTFQKTVQQLSRWKGDELEEEELPELRAEDGRLMGESVQFCIAILELYVMKEEKAVLKDEETAKGASIVADLKLCHVSLGELLKCREFDRFAELLGDGAPVLRLKLEDLYSQLEKRLRPDGEDEEGETREMDVARCLRDLTHPLMPLQAHALITLKYLIVQRDPAIEGHFEGIKDALKGCLANSDSYIYLAAINTLGQLAIRHTQAVLPLLLEQFASGTSRRSAVDRLKTGEVLRQLARSIGDFAYHYADSFIGRLLPVVKCGNEPELRMSALSVLGEYCSAYQHGLGKYIVELTAMIEGIAEETGAPIEVTRAAAFFLRYLLQGLTADGALNLAEHMRLLYGTVKRFDRHLDEVVMMHAGLARDELSRISEELLRREGTPGERGSFLRESKMATLIGKE